MLNEIEKLHCEDDEEFHITERGTYWKYGSFTKKELVNYSKNITGDQNDYWSIYKDMFSGDIDYETENYFIRPME